MSDRSKRRMNSGVKGSELKTWPSRQTGGIK
jgi:hypothetical protein